MNLLGRFGYSEAESAAAQLLKVHKSGRSMFRITDLVDDHQITGMIILLSSGFLVHNSMGSSHGYFKFTESFWNRLIEEIK